MPVTYLILEDYEHTQVATLGAQQDAVGRWYVPDGLALAHFQDWLPATPSTAVALPTAAGVSLSALLARCSTAIKSSFPDPVWVRIEISQLKASSGHLYLVAIERAPGENTRELARTNAMIWSSNVTRIVNKFSAATNMELARGLQVLVLVKPELHPQFGLSLQILDIDPTYTLGDLEARLKKIREDLAASGDARKNLDLPSPDDFYHVCVISPVGAAGLEDFQAEADKLAAAGLCRFTYVTAIFQGEKARQSIKEAFVEAHYANDATPFCALALIRGGGATADLHWLEDHLLARMVCRFHCPVFTGIGHERDKSILDEYANKAFGTPSKVIAHIKDTITGKAVAGYENWTAIANAVTARLDAADARTSQRMAEIETGADKRLAAAMFTVDATMVATNTLAGARLQSAESKTTALNTELTRSAMNAIDLASKNIDHHFVTVTDNVTVALTTHATRIDSDFGAITLAARRSMDGIDAHLDDQIRNLAGSATARVLAAEVATNRHAEDVQYYARRTLDAADTGSRELMAGILAHGIEPTLRRGFAMIRTAQGPVSTKAAASENNELEIVFRDGTMTVQQGRDHG